MKKLMLFFVITGCLSCTKAQLKCSQIITSEVLTTPVDFFQDNTWTMIERGAYQNGMLILPDGFQLTYWEDANNQGFFQFNISDRNNPSDYFQLRMLGDNYAFLNGGTTEINALYIEIKGSMMALHVYSTAPIKIINEAVYYLVNSDYTDCQTLILDFHPDDYFQK